MGNSVSSSKIFNQLRQWFGSLSAALGKVFSTEFKSLKLDLKNNRSSIIKAIVLIAIVGTVIANYFLIRRGQRIYRDQQFKYLTSLSNPNSEAFKENGLTPLQLLPKNFKLLEIDPNKLKLFGSNAPKFLQKLNNSKLQAAINEISLLLYQVFSWTVNTIFFFTPFLQIYFPVTFADYVLKLNISEKRENAPKAGKALSDEIIKEFKEYVAIVNNPKAAKQIKQVFEVIYRKEEPKASNESVQYSPLSPPATPRKTRPNQISIKRKPKNSCTQSTLLPASTILKTSNHEEVELIYNKEEGFTVSPTKNAPKNIKIDLGNNLTLSLDKVVSIANQITHNSFFTHLLQGEKDLYIMEIQHTI